MTTFFGAGKVDYPSVFTITKNKNYDVSHGIFVLASHSLGDSFLYAERMEVNS